MSFTIKVNGNTHTVDVDGDTPLLWVLRDVVGMTGTKFGCGAALCGACTVHVDGAATRSCVTPIDSVGGSAITTIEGIGATPQGKALQRAWLDLEVAQCGYCQSGPIMSARSQATPLDRRGFLKAGASFAGGLVLTVAVPQVRRPALAAAAPSGFAP